MLHVKVKRVTKSARHKEKIYFSISLMLYIYEMIYTQQTYCDNHFMMYVSQIIMLYTLNLYSAVCQLKN